MNVLTGQQITPEIILNLLNFNIINSRRFVHIALIKKTFSDIIQSLNYLTFLFVVIKKCGC